MCVYVNVCMHVWYTPMRVCVCMWYTCMCVYSYGSI